MSHGPIGIEGGEVDNSTDSAIRAAGGRGHPLDSSIRGSMERSFGVAFSGVRVHTDANADALNRRIQATAFTTGSDIFFSNGQYDPNSRGGQELLAHELAHVVQQGGVPHGENAVSRRSELDAPSDDGTGAPTMTRTSAGSGVTKISMRGGQGAVGSVTVRPVGRTAVEATDLEVVSSHRGRGFGAELIAAAADVGARAGRSRVRLGSQDSGTGKLDGWYESLGFRPTGEGSDGRTRFEAPTSTVAAQRVQRSVTKLAPRSPEVGPRLRAIARRDALVQRMERDEPKKIKDISAKIGLELTFANAYTAASLKENHNLPHGFSEIFDAFLDSLRDELADGGVFFLEQLQRVQAKKEIFAGQCPQDAKFCFVATDEAVDEVDRSWWLTVSLDPGVIEVQTMPLPGSVFGSDDWRATVIDSFFEAMKVVQLAGQKLTPATETGGGHINIDFVDAGVPDLAALVRLIKLWSDVSRRLQSRREFFESTHTAALLDDTRMERKGENLDNRADFANKLATGLAEVTNTKEWTKAKKQLVELFFKFPHASMVDDRPGFMSMHLGTNSKQVEDEKKIAMHNQAINVEHIDEANEAERRLEFRNIRAQTSLDDIVRSIRICVTVIDAAVAGKGEHTTAGMVDQILPEDTEKK